MEVSTRSLYGLDWVNFFLADVQTGVGPFLAIYLAGNGWNQESVGMVLAVGGIAGILTQTPAGALADAAQKKRALVAAGVITLALSAMLIAWLPVSWSVICSQVLIGASSSLFGPAICAISLGLVGRQLFDRRQGRNQTFNSAGNVFAALAMGLLGYYVSNRSIFYFVVAMAVVTLLMLGFIRPGEIDFEAARGAKRDGGSERPAPIRELLQDRRLLIFLICSVLFHFANAAMLPLLGERLAQGKGRDSMMFISVCVITTQLITTLLAAWTGKMAGRWGRKPLLLIAFAVLPARGLLYTLTNNTFALVAIQILDGIGAGIFGVVSVLVVADLTRGSGRFNLTLGSIGTAVGIGASLSQLMAGYIVHHSTFNVGFIFLACVALAALGVLCFFMPETRDESFFQEN